MNKSKLLVLWVLTFVTGLLVGGTSMRWYQATHTPAVVACPAMQWNNPQVDLLLARLEEMGTPNGVSEVVQDNTPRSSAELPSNLVRTELPKDLVISMSAPAPQEKKNAKAKAPNIVLTDEQETVVLSASQPAQRAADGSNRTLIKAPVEVKRIQTLDQYKEFKKQARGSYPTVDLDKEEVIVLESASSLPDNVFEIVGIFSNDKRISVLYRVNVLGLDQKINTHSAQKMKKSSLPIILEQVL